MRETKESSLPADSALLDPSSRELVLVICDRDGPTSVPFPEHAELTIGRCSSCPCVLKDPSVSRVHARFSYLDGQVWVEDLNSRHGTWIAGQRIQRARLPLGSSVRVADVSIVVARAVSPSALPESLEPRVREALYLSPRTRALRDLLLRAARTDLPVLILGETGSGKELAAREIHASSPRAKGPLRVLNCAAISPHLIESTLFGHERGAFTGADRARAGIFEEAHGGTLFLDELGELSPAAQAALLRVLETNTLTRVGSHREIHVDVRIVAATHRSLQVMATRGEFRVDLLHRLCVISVELPPLRQRRDEIPAFVRHFWAQTGVAREISPEALGLLEQYDWPGNFRELRNVLTGAAALGQGATLAVDDLPAAIAHSRRGPADTVQPAPAAELELRAQLAAMEHAEVTRALERTGGNQREASALLGMPLRTFERRLQRIRQRQAIR